MTPKKPENNSADNNQVDSLQSADIADPNPTKNAENKKDVENENPQKQTIPGLPEEEYLKQLKLKKKERKKRLKKSLDQDESTNLSREDFLISPESGLMKNKENILRSFEFSDYEEDS